MDHLLTRASQLWTLAAVLLFLLAGTATASDSFPSPSPQGVLPARVDSATWLTLAVMSTLIVTGSLIGGLLPERLDLSHQRMQYIMSFVGGLMMGNALLHLLPHAARELKSIDSACRWAMWGMIAMFFMLRAFHFHQHDAGDGRNPTPHDHDHDHAHDHDHDHDSHSLREDNVSSQAGSHGHEAPLTWTGIAIGLSIHTLLDGIALAATVVADAAHGAAGALLGVGTFLAVLLHKPLDAVTVTTMMKAQGWSLRHRVIVNLVFSLMCPLGVVLFAVGVMQSAGSHTLVGAALGFSAGIFFCIAMSDLLPEIEFHTHDRIPLSLALLSGIALAWGIGFLEPSFIHTP